MTEYDSVLQCIPVNDSGWQGIRCMTVDGSINFNDDREGDNTKKYVAVQVY